LEIKNVVVLSGKSVQIKLESFKTNSEYDSLILSYSDDPLMVDRLTDVKLNIKDYQDSFSKPIEIDHLQSGLQYHFNIKAGFKNVMGSPSKPFGILVDEIPNPPILSHTIVNIDPAEIRISFNPSEIKGSAVLRYRLYHSAIESFEEHYLTCDESVEQLREEKGNFILNVSKPRWATPYYFRLTAINLMGESILSNISKETRVDVPPNTPLKPTAKKISKNSIQISTTTPESKGSPIVKYRIISQKVTVQNDNLEIVPDSDQEYFIKIKPGKALEYKIEVEHDTSYRFYVSAGNHVGFSEYSPWSDTFNIGIMELIRPLSSQTRIHQDRYSIERFFLS
jgi:hypothetical protein